MNVYVGSDHNGYHLKEILTAYLCKAGHTVVDTGNKTQNPEDDYPEFAARAVAAILASNDQQPRAILLCGSGQGMCMAANRYKGIRAALGWSKTAAISSRNDDDSNVLCLPAKELSEKELLDIVDTWLTTPFAGASRFVRRIKEMDA